MSQNRIHLKRFVGAHIHPYLEALARLRITVFRDFPYLYDGNLAYEMKYLQTYSRADESVFVVAFDSLTVVGVSTGVPMAAEEEAFKRPFLQQGYDPHCIFYFGESVLLRPYRGQGIGVRFFQEREAYAQALGRFEYTAFCAVDRPDDHPRRPPDYKPLDPFWHKRGYKKHPEFNTTYVWKDVDEAEESPKPMTFWMKKLG